MSTSERVLYYRPGDTIAVQYLGHTPGTSRFATAWAPADWWLLSFLLLLCFGIATGLVTLAAWWTRHEAFFHLISRLGLDAVFLPIRKRQRRAKLLESPLPHTWLEYLRRNVRAYQLLTPAEQEKLHKDLRIFIAEKRWEGCGGLTITDEIKVTIAAQACLLVLGIEHDYYSHVTSILVYPSEFKDPKGERRPDGIIHDDIGKLGEAWYRGPVILSWDDVLAGGQDHSDGHNVVFHEFAHQLDFLGEWSGAGLSGDDERRRNWHEVMTREYHQLVEDTENGRVTLLDPYGATDSREFFAVATECFFEQPVQMQAQHAQLYNVLRDFFGQDPAVRSTRK
jgi:hypothetical protein